MRHIREILFSHVILTFALVFWSSVTVFAQPKAPEGMVLPDLATSFRILAENRVVYRAYQDSVNANIGDGVWMAFMHRRASVCQRIYKQNTAIIKEISDYFSQKPDVIPSSAYDSLYNSLRSLDDDVYTDVFLLEQFVDMLLPHYEAESDTVRMLVLNNYVGYYSADIARSYELSSGARSVKYYKRNIELARGMSSLSSEQVYCVSLAYANICLMLSALGHVTPSEAFAFAEDYESFLKKHGDVLDPESKEVCEGYLMDIRTTLFRIYADIDAKWVGADSVAFAKMFEHSAFKRSGLPSLRSAEDSLYYYHSMAMMGEMPVMEAYNVCNKILQQRFDLMERTDTITENEILSIGNCLMSTFTLMEKCSFEESIMSQSAVYWTYRLVGLVQRACVFRDYAFFDYILSELASIKGIISHLPTGMKEPYLNELIVKSQVGTVVHVSMVESLCSTFLDGLLDICPEQFVGILGCKTVEDVLDRRVLLAQYVTMAARFHDVGKNKMAEIVGNNYRALTDHEFSIIKKHPEFALEYLDMDPQFERYKDVALGHHKWYNGKGGYPESFDNVASPWRAMIDLVTICDCIDAAVDYLGRNYRVPKTLDEVVAEFKRDAGVRYNPVMVDALANNKDLYERIEKILEEERPRQARMVRSRYIRSSY